MPVNADAGGKLLAWLAIGSGSLLAYSAYKNRAPWDVLRDIQGEPISTPASSVTTGASSFYSGGATDGSFSASVPRIRQIANREIPPDLVDIGQGMQLDRDAAASFLRASKRAGYVGGIPLTSAYRTFASQAADYYGDNPVLADGSRRYGDPNRSLHVVGLAIDVNSYNASQQNVKDALSTEGWQLPRPNAEPWHWSYLVRG